MVWGRLDDHAWQNEKLIGLSCAGYRLYFVALSFAASEWPSGDGQFTPERAKSLARMHGIEDIDAAITELVETRLWERGDRLLRIHDIEKYMLSTEAHRSKTEAGRKGGVASVAARRATIGTAIPVNARNALSYNDTNRSSDRTTDRSRTEAPAEAATEAVTRNPELTPLSPNGDIPPGQATSNGTRSKRRSPNEEWVREVFDAWVVSTGRRDCHLTDGRREKITARLRDGYPLADLIDAVRGWKQDPWSERPRNNDLIVLLRNGAYLEKFRDLQRGAVTASAASSWDS